MTRSTVASLAAVSSLLLLGACSGGDSNGHAPFIGQGSGGSAGSGAGPDASVDGTGGDGAGGDGSGASGNGGRGGRGGKAGAENSGGNPNAGGTGQGGNDNSGGNPNAGGTGQGGAGADGGIPNAGGAGGQGGTGGDGAGGDGAGGARTCALSVGNSGCDNCIRVKCNDSCLNCEDDPECAAIAQCLDTQGCFTAGSNRQTCLNDCKSAHANGTDLMNKVIQCGLVCSGFGC